MNLFDLENEVAVVIGGAAVLGDAMGRALRKARVGFAVLGHHAGLGAARAAAIKKEGGIAASFPVDAVDLDSLSAAHRRVEKQFGESTTLVKAAGDNDVNATVTPELRVDRIRLNKRQKSFGLNFVVGTVLSRQECSAAIACRGRGSIINIASVAARLPLWQFSSKILGIIAVGYVV